MCGGIDTDNHSKALSVPVVFLRLDYIEFDLAHWKTFCIHLTGFPVTSLKIVSVSKFLV